MYPFGLFSLSSLAQIRQMGVNMALLYSFLDQLNKVQQEFVVPGQGELCFFCYEKHVIATVEVGFNFKQRGSNLCIFIHENKRRMQVALYLNDLIVAGENETETQTMKCRLAPQFDRYTYTA